MHLPTGLRATKAGLQLTFTDEVDARTISKDQFAIQTWSLKRTANYGSKHYDEKNLTVRGVKISDDGKTITVDVLDLQPTWGMEIKYTLPFRDGQTQDAIAHEFQPLVRSARSLAGRGPVRHRFFQ